MSNVISLKDVTFAYNGGDNAVEGVNLEVEEGAFLAIIGPNGGGKTTLVKLMLGLLRPASGTVSVLGADPAEIVPQVGYVPQHAAIEASFPIRVMDVVLLGLCRTKCQRFGLPRGQRDQAMEALRMVEMERYAQHRFDELSGGQRQRVLVARAIVARPKLLLFDEPTSNIDPHGKICLFDMMAEFSKTLTVVMVSHDLISASAGITEVAVVNRQLIQGGEITPEMLGLIYGTHDHSCPLDGYLRSLSAVLENRGGLRHG